MCVCVCACACACACVCVRAYVWIYIYRTVVLADVTTGTPHVLVNVAPQPIPKQGHGHNSPRKYILGTLSPSTPDPVTVTERLPSETRESFLWRLLYPLQRAKRIVVSRSVMREVGGIWRDRKVTTDIRGTYGSADELSVNHKVNLSCQFTIYLRKCVESVKVHAWQSTSKGRKMPSRAEVVLGVTVIGSIATVFYVHHQQSADRKVSLSLTSLAISPCLSLQLN